MYAFIQPNPLAHLDLIDYACQDLMISFAVVNKEAGLSNFSPITNVTVAIRGNHILLIKEYWNCLDLQKLLRDVFFNL